jgi:hypothetical protein
VYVSSSTGNDGYSGLSESAPKRTIAAGYALLRHGYPDWIMLKRGDVWYENLGHWRKSGRSPSEMMVITSYGPSTLRPQLRTGVTEGLFRSGGNNSPTRIDYLALVGVAFFPEAYDGNNGTPAGFSWLGAGANILIEDCKFEGYYDGLSIQMDGSNRVGPIAIRRSVVVDSYGNQGHAQGIFASGVDGLLLEENIFDHNGWKEGVSDPDIFKHNVYLTIYNTGVTVRGNIFTRASAHGLQLRCGGVAEGNLFVRNPLGMFVSAGEGFQSVVRGNVIQEGTDIGPGLYRGFGIETVDTYDALVEDNIVSNALVNHTWGDAFSVSSTPDSQVLTSRYQALFRNNIVYNWHGTGFDVSYPDCTVYDQIQFQGNRISGQTNSFIGMYVPSVVDLSRFGFSGNSYWTAAQTGQWFFRSGANASFPTWVGAFVEPGTIQSGPNFPAPLRTMASYQTSLGGNASFDEFIYQARFQTRYYWRNEYTAAAAIAYVRAGFGLGGQPCVGDLDGNHRVDVADAVLFQSLFVARNMAADLNRDNQLNILDFVAFQAAAAQGCP